MYKDITADDKRAIRDVVYAHLEELGVPVGADPNKRLIGSTVIFLLGAGDDDLSPLGSGMGYDWYAPLDDVTGVSPNPHGAPLPEDFMLLTTHYFVAKQIYSHYNVDVHERRQLRGIVEILKKKYSKWVDEARAREVLEQVNKWDF